MGANYHCLTACFDANADKQTQSLPSPGEEGFHTEWIAKRDNRRCLYLNIPLRRQKETRLAFGDCRSIANGHSFEEDTL